jgi:uncharacterized membrane protein YfcA
LETERLLNTTTIGYPEEYVMDPGLLYLVILVLTGAVVGVASGLFGVGGGFFMVPAQFWTLGMLGVDPETALRTASGTSLAVIIPTAASAAWVHHCRKSIRWDAVQGMGSSAAIFSFLGAMLSTRLPTEPLEFLFGLVLVAAALEMIRSKRCDMAGPPGPAGSIWEAGAIGVPVGLLSGLLGIGGGVVLVPLMTVLLRYPVHVAIGTSSLVILCAAIGGVVGYAASTPAPIMVLPWSVGYIHLIGVLALSFGSIPTAQFGARLAHACAPRLLRTMLAGVMIVFGFLMLDLPRLVGF